jgi:hypothetical protein
MNWSSEEAQHASDVYHESLDVYAAAHAEEAPAPAPHPAPALAITKRSLWARSAPVSSTPAASSATLAPEDERYASEPYSEEVFEEPLLWWKVCLTFDPSVHLILSKTPVTLQGLSSSC